MTTAINACQILPSSDAVSCAGPTEWASGKSQGGFADTPALTKVREELQSDKVDGDPNPGGGPSTGEQAVAHTAEHPSVPAKEKQKAATEQAVAMGQPHGPEGMLVQTQVARGQAKVEPGDVGAKDPSQPSKGVSDGPAATGQPAPRGLERTNQNGAIIERVDRPRHRQAGRADLPPDNIRPSVAVRAVAGEQPLDIKPGSEQAAPKVPAQRQGLAGAAAQVPEQNVGGLLPEKHQAASSAGGGHPSGRNVGAETVPAPGKEGRSIEPKRGFPMRAEFALSSSGESMPVSQRISTPAQTPIRDNAASRSPVRHIGEQILDSVQASLSRGDRQVLVRLHPSELGTVLVRFREQGEHITALLEVGRSDTRHEIEQALPQVLRGLQDAGVQVRRFEVVMSDQPERDFSRGLWQQDAGFQQQGSGQGGDPPPMSTPASWSQGGVGRSSESEELSSIPRQAGVVQDRLDILL